MTKEHRRKLTLKNGTTISFVGDDACFFRGAAKEPMIFDQTYLDPPLTLDDVRARLNATLDSIGQNAKMRFHASCGDDRGIIEISWRHDGYSDEPLSMSMFASKKDYLRAIEDRKIAKRTDQNDG